jgi:hypothetical protein
VEVELLTLLVLLLQENLSPDILEKKSKKENMTSSLDTSKCFF